MLEGAHQLLDQPFVLSFSVLHDFASGLIAVGNESDFIANSAQGYF
jgi:hypothetical protein